jgi:hypothetical protein
MGAIIRFDLGRYLRANSTWIYFVILGTLSYLFMAASTRASLAFLGETRTKAGTST